MFFFVKKKWLIGIVSQIDANPNNYRSIYIYISLVKVKGKLNWEFIRSLKSNIRPHINIYIY